MPKRKTMPLTLLLTGFVIFLVCVSSSLTTIRAQEKSVDPGLVGLLPEFAPLDLTQDEFLRLGDTWKNWSVGVAAEVAKLYEEQNDLAGQRAILSTLRKKIGTMEKALADRRYRLIFDPLATMHSRLTRRVDIAEAALDTLELDPAAAHTAYLQKTRSEVAASANKLKSFLNGVNGGKPWIAYMRLDQLAGEQPNLDSMRNVASKLAKRGKLKSEKQRSFMNRDQFVQLADSLAKHISATESAAPTVDIAKLRDALAGLLQAVESYEEIPTSKNANAIHAALARTRIHAADSGQLVGSAIEKHYMNFNMRVVASERFLNKLVAYEHTDDSPVDDFILGAKVDGTQLTVGTVGIDLRPGDNNIRFLMTFDGVTNSRTQGVTEQATIFTSGHHTFKVEKNITFDGDVFTTKPATIRVRANNNTTGARTKYSNVPLFGGITNQIAVREARRRKSESEAVARQRLSAKVLPMFNEMVDAEFKKHSMAMTKTVIPKLHDSELYPARRQFKSSNHTLWSNTLTMADGELGGNSPILTAGSSRGVAIHLHESVINNSLARLPLAGQTMTEAQLATELSRSLGSLLGTELKIEPAGEPDPTQFIFPDSDVIRVRIVSNQVLLSLRAGLKTEDDSIPTQIITVPLSFAIEGNDIVVSADKVDVQPAEPPESRVKQRVQAGVVETKVQKALPTRKLDRHINAKRPDGSAVKISVTQIKPVAGWLSIVIE